MEAREAATVILLRASPSGFEVFMQRRASTMVFAPGMTVFPGGAREPQDVDVRATAVRETEEETGVQIDPESLVQWSRWVTPEGEVRRYDTHFFVAPVPATAAPAARGTEMDQVSWLAPAEALSQFEAGLLPMWPPTIVTLHELAACADVEAVLAAAALRDDVAVQPVILSDEDGLVIEMPDGTRFRRSGPS